MSNDEKVYEALARGVSDSLGALVEYFRHVDDEREALRVQCEEAQRLLAAVIEDYDQHFKLEHRDREAMRKWLADRGWKSRLTATEGPHDA